MLDAYSSGDPYLAFAKQAEAIPPDGTKETHPGIRDQYKQCALAVQYGMGAEALASSLNVSPAQARWLLQRHHETYPKFWQWSDAVEMYAFLENTLWTVFGWNLYLGARSTPAPCEIFPCKPMGPRCSDWLVV
jgi:DNA polymerase I-like protein with 3'-5' exonuclease and polymerase domains